MTALRWLLLTVATGMVGQLCLAAEPLDSAQVAAGKNGSIRVLTLTPPQDVIGLALAPGDGSPAQLVLEGGDGKNRILTLSVSAQTGKRRRPAPADAPKNAKPVYEEVKAADSFVTVSGTNLQLFARPNLARYTDAQQEELLRRWDSLPAAAQTLMHYEFRNRPGRVEMWLNGCYAGEVALAGGLRRLQVKLPPGAVLRDAAAYQRPAVEERYCALDVRRRARPGALRDANVSLPSGLQRVGGVPLFVADGPGNGDVGVVREMKGSWALECDEHLSRTPFDGMLETLHFSVPQAVYHRAYVLCAAEPDPRKEPVLTVRMTRFARSGRGDALTHASVVLPRGDEPAAANLRRVGTVAYLADGKRVEVPLYLAAIDLDAGAILDLLTSTSDPHAAMLDGRHLDIDLLGRLQGIKPAQGSTSAVHVFGLTLERSPARFSLAPGQPGHIFYKEETPETVAVIQAAEPTRAVLSWQIRDVGGSLVREGQAELSFAAAGDERRQKISLTVPRVGWYGLKFSLSASANAQPYFVHDAAFAVLGPDRRQAGYESPYGVWWFGGAHYGCDDVSIIGPLLHKAGFRKTTFGWTKYTEADFAPWKVTLNQIGWIFKPDDPAGSAKKVADWRARFPHCRSILIFHESYGNYLPDELFGEKPREDEQTIARAQQRVRIATLAARLYREKFPELKILVGNTSASAAIIGSLLRHGFDPSLIDFMGIETAAGQTGIPEKLWEGGPQGAYLAREMARRFGHDLPVTGCYEYTARCERNLGPQRHAEFYVRDVLLAHAYRYHHISPGLLYDAGNAYAHTLWGAGGLCRRYPLLYPRPAYVALAAVTAALDRVTFRREVPTGSLTVHVLEFDRADGRHSYALWTPRASVELSLDFPAGTEVERTDFYGAVSKSSDDARRTLIAGSAPQYLTTTHRLTAAQVVRQITEPEPKAFRAADALADAENWSLVRDLSLTKTTGELPRHVPGKFRLRSVRDEQRGPCLELELDGNRSLPDLVGEYAVLAAARPVPLTGEPHTLGVWVKGNSSWGKVVFEFEDAAGGVWRTHANEWHDWPGELSINFDGWHFIQFPIDTQSPILHVSPGGRCQRMKGTSARMTYPLRLTRLYVVMNRKALALTEMKPVTPRIRLSGVGGY